MTRPPKMSATLPGVKKLDTNYEGFDAYEWQSGTWSVVLPELNFFQVKIKTSTGRTEGYTNIAVGEPSPDLFVPQPGATITQVAPPRSPGSRP